MGTIGFSPTPPGRASSTLQGIRLGVLGGASSPLPPMVTELPEMKLPDKNLPRREVTRRNAKETTRLFTHRAVDSSSHYLDYRCDCYSQPAASAHCRQRIFGGQFHPHHEHSAGHFSVHLSHGWLRRYSRGLGTCRVHRLHHTHFRQRLSD